MSLARYRAGDRLFRLVTYVFVITSGLFALLAPPRSYSAFSGVLTDGWTWGQLIAGAIALAGLILHKPRIEMGVVGIIAASIALYAMLGWFQVFTVAASHGARASDITALACLFAARFLWLGGQRRAVEEEAVARAAVRGHSA